MLFSQRGSNCKAVSYVELWSLSRDDLERLCGDSPEMEEKMQKCAQQRLAAHHVTSQISLTRPRLPHRCAQQRLAAQLHYELQHDEAKQANAEDGEGGRERRNSDDSVTALPPGMMKGGDGGTPDKSKITLGAGNEESKGKGSDDNDVASPVTSPVTSPVGTEL